MIILLQSASSGWAVAVIGIAATASAVPLVIRRSRRADVFLPASVLMNPRIVRVCLLAGLIPAAWFALLAAVPTELASNGWSPLQVGVAMLPSIVVALVVPRLAPRITERWGQRASLSGAAVAATAAVVIGAVGVTLGSAVLMVASVAMVGGAFAVGQPAMFAMVADAAEADSRGVAAGFAALVFLTCGSAGSAVLGGVVGIGGVAGGLAVLAGVTALEISLLVVTGRPHTAR